MGMIEEAVHLELFNDRRFMTLARMAVTGMPYSNARVTVMGLIQDELESQWEATVFGGNAIATIVSWSMGNVDYDRLARECLDILGVQ